MAMLISFLKLIRFQNLLMISLMQCLFHYGFLKMQPLTLALNNWQFGVLLVATFCIAAAGYLINNLIDQETDSVNQKNLRLIGESISEKMAYNAYFALNVLGVIAGFVISNCIQKPNFASVFILISVVLYLYATTFKQILLVGNLVIAILTAFSVIIIAIFDLYPIINPENQPLIATLFQIILDFALFAFLINFVREIIKDLEDINGDKQQSISTLPIEIGVSKTIKLVAILSGMIIIYLFYYCYVYYFKNNLLAATLYQIIFVLSPLLYFCLQLPKSKTQSEFHHLSSILKIVLFFGIFSVLIITLNIKYNA